VAISSRRLVAADDAGIGLRWKKYRIDGMADNAASPPHKFITICPRAPTAFARGFGAHGPSET
jgi:hypothetical protein